MISLLHDWKERIQSRAGVRALAAITVAAAVGVIGTEILAFRRAHLWESQVRQPRHKLAAVQRSRLRASAIHLKRGNELAQEGKGKAAIEQYRQALEADPESALAHNNLGNVFLEQGDTDEAIRHYRRALGADPAYGLAHENLGNALLAKGQIDEAMAHYRRALAADPKMIDARSGLAGAGGGRGARGGA